MKKVQPTEYMIDELEITPKDNIITCRHIYNKERQRAVRWSGENMDEVRRLTGDNPVLFDPFTQTLIFPVMGYNYFARVGDYIMEVDGGNGTHHIITTQKNVMELYYKEIVRQHHEI